MDKQIKRMSDRAFANLILLAFFCAASFLFIIIDGDLADLKVDPIHFAVGVFIILSFAALFFLLLADRLAVRPYLPKDSAQSSPSNPKLLTPKGRFRIFYLVFCSWAMLPCIYGFMLYIIGGPAKVASDLFILTFGCLTYVRLRSHTRWEKLFINNDGSEG